MWCGGGGEGLESNRSQFIASPTHVDILVVLVVQIVGRKGLPVDIPHVLSVASSNLLHLSHGLSEKQNPQHQLSVHPSSAGHPRH